MVADVAIDIGRIQPLGRSVQLRKSVLELAHSGRVDVEEKECAGRRKASAQRQWPGSPGTSLDDGPWR